MRYLPYGIVAFRLRVTSNKLFVRVAAEYRGFWSSNAILANLAKLKKTNYSLSFLGSGLTKSKNFFRTI